MQANIFGKVETYGVTIEQAAKTAMFQLRQLEIGLRQVT